MNKMNNNLYINQFSKVKTVKYMLHIFFIYIYNENNFYK